jgi:metal-dependent amidase/aminoacylase/carboxypeptidase family protein
VSEDDGGAGGTAGSAAREPPPGDVEIIGRAHADEVGCQSVLVEGVQVHGSTPWLGVDPMPAAADIIGGAAQLYRQLPAFDPITITIGHVEDVGRFNIVPGHVTLFGTIRCSIDSDMAEVQRRLTGMAENIARA